MTIAPSIASLNPGWLDGLAILRRVIDSHDIRAIWESFEPSWEVDSGSKLVTVGTAEPDARFSLFILTTTDPIDLPRIERVEIMTYAACGAWFLQNFPGSPFHGEPREAFRHLCHRAGCYWRNTPDIRERWRLIDYESAASTLPNACFEDRARCQVCRQPVATGAGAWNRYPDQGEAHGLSRSGDARFRLVDDEYCTYRPDIHEECLRYAHRVLLPQVKAAREAATHA
jgi:hypothetical protein